MAINVIRDRLGEYSPDARTIGPATALNVAYAAIKYTMILMQQSDR